MSYIGTQPIPKATLLRTTGVLASASTTINVPATFTPGNTWVFINGAYVLPSDYDDSNGTDLIFATALDAGTEYIVMEALQFEGSITPSLAGGASANFTSMPQVGGDPIVESGSNADGEWTRWADGTQHTSARTFAGTWTYPVSFTSSPEVGATPNNGGPNIIASFTPSGGTSGVLKTNDTNPPAVRTGHTVNVLATGRWK